MFMFLSFITEIDECMYIPCYNDATCVDEIAYFTCDCVAGYTGALCETGNCIVPWSLKSSLCIVNHGHINHIYKTHENYTQSGAQ